MGEIADWLIQGGGCEWCGERIGGEAGYPRLCGGCAKEARQEGYKVRRDGSGGFQIVHRPEEKE